MSDNRHALKDNMVFQIWPNLTFSDLVQLYGALQLKWSSLRSELFSVYQTQCGQIYFQLWGRMKKKVMSQWCKMQKNEILMSE